MSCQRDSEAHDYLGGSCETPLPYTVEARLYNGDYSDRAAEVGLHLISLLDSVTDILLGQWQHHRTRSYHSRLKGRPLLEECDLYSKNVITMSLAEDIELGTRLSGYFPRHGIVCTRTMCTVKHYATAWRRSDLGTGRSALPRTRCGRQ